MRELATRHVLDSELTGQREREEMGASWGTVVVAVTPTITDDYRATCQSRLRLIDLVGYCRDSWICVSVNSIPCYGYTYSVSTCACLGFVRLFVIMSVCLSVVYLFTCLLNVHVSTMSLIVRNVCILFCMLCVLFF